MMEAAVVHSGFRENVVIDYCLSRQGLRDDVTVIRIDKNLSR